MKRGAAAFLGVLLLLACAAAAVAYGAHRHYAEEKTRVESALASLDALYSERVEVGNNILTVARRHLGASDPLAEAVRADVAALASPGQRPAKADANAKLQADGKALLSALAALPSVQGDVRDLGYVTGLLPHALDRSSVWADAAKYDAAAAAFNGRLNGTLQGWLAKLFGVGEAALMGGTR